MNKQEELMKELQDIINVAKVARMDLVHGFKDNIPVIAIAAIQSSLDKCNELRIQK